MNRRRLVTAAAAIMGAMAGGGALPAAGPARALAQWTPIPLSYTAWTLIGIAYPDGGYSAAVPERYKIYFGDEGRASLRIDCNSGVAGWSVSGFTISIGGVGSTLMLCPNQDPLEREFGRLISEAAWWSLEGDTLTITTSGGATMTFRQTVMTAP